METVGWEQRRERGWSRSMGSTSLFEDQKPVCSFGSRRLYVQKTSPGSQQVTAQTPDTEGRIGEILVHLSCCRIFGRGVPPRNFLGDRLGVEPEKAGAAQESNGRLPPCRRVHALEPIFLLLLLSVAGEGLKAENFDARRGRRVGFCSWCLGSPGLSTHPQTVWLAG